MFQLNDCDYKVSYYQFACGFLSIHFNVVLQRVYCENANICLFNLTYV